MADHTPYPPGRLSRVGVAAAATGTPGRQPAFGMATDLANAEFETENEFLEFLRAQTAVTQSENIAMAEAGITSTMHDEALERARNYEETGYALKDSDFSNRDDDDENWFMRRANDIQTGFRQVGQGLWGELLGTSSTFGGKAEVPEGEELDFEEYRRLGGALTQEEFESFSPETRYFLLEDLRGKGELSSVANLPGIKQGLYAAGQAYRGVTTAVDVDNLATKGGFDPSVYFSGRAWQQAWREAETRSLGNAIVDNVLDPYTTDEQLDEWRRNNSLYQMSSVGTEFAVGWYADAGVLAARGAGNLGRLAKNELPRENTLVGNLTRRSLAGEAISSRVPAVRDYANWRAERIRQGQRGVEDYANTVSFSEFARLPMFRNSASVGGVAAARAIYLAAKAKKAGDVGGDQLMDLTWRALYADPKAWHQIRQLNNGVPEEMREFGPKAQTFIDAVNATRTKAQQFTDEIEALQRRKATDHHPFFQWESDLDLTEKQASLARAQEVLDRYENYGEWLETAKGGSSMLGQVRGPSNRALRRHNEGKTRLFMDNQFGYAHRYVSIGRQSYVKKSMLASMHDLDSGVRSIHTQFDNMSQLGYVVPEQRAHFVEAFTKAETAMDRYKVLHQIEREHAIPALAQKLGVSVELVDALYDKIRLEQNRTIEGVLTGSGRTYSSAPSLAQRLDDEATDIQMVEPSQRNWNFTSRPPEPEEGMVTVRFMQGQQQVEVELPQEALTTWSDPSKIVDVTQTPNYYQPLDMRRVYLELKRHRDVLDEVDANLLRRGGADLGHYVDLVGTRINSIWKPLQLWRLGWPQRVLMDEGMRAMAVLGPMYWITGPGAEAVGLGAMNLATAVQRKVTGQSRLDLTKGPLHPSTKRTPRIEREAELRNAPMIAASSFPRINRAAAERLLKATEAEKNYVRVQASQTLLAREMSRTGYVANDLAPWERELMGLPESDGPTLATVEDVAIPKGMVQGKYVTAQMARNNKILEGPRPTHPITAIRTLAPQGQDGISVYDPHTGKLKFTQSRKDLGTVVPLTHIEDIGVFNDKALDWFEKNAELLSREGVVLMRQGDRLSIGLRFTKKNRTRANAYLLAQHKARPNPDEPSWMIDLATGKRQYVVDDDYVSPITEQLLREFEVSPGEKVFQPGARLDELTEGAPTPAQSVFHGASTPLPEQLLPREQAPIMSGRMMGDGLYTTVSKQLGEAYSAHPENSLYTIRNVRSGRKERVFDADDHMAPTDAEDWAEFSARRNMYDENDINFLDQEISQYERHYNEFIELWRNSKDSFRTVTGKNPTWANFFEYLDSRYGLGRTNQLQKELTAFLEEVKGAGAITHKGGTVWGTGEGHQVYVWLHPEDLEVKPAYVPNGKWETVAHHFMNPTGPMSLIENPVPQNRITRVKPGPVVEPDTSRINGDLRRAEVQELDAVADPFDSFDIETDSVRSWLARAIFKEREQGRGYMKLRDEDGKEIIVPKAFEGHDGGVMRALVSSDRTYDYLTEGHGGALDMMRSAAAGHRTFHPPVFDAQTLTKGTQKNKKAIEYFQRWADMVNDQIGNSPIWSRMLQGQSDEQIVDWLNNTPEGAQLRRELPTLGDHPELWIEEHRAKLDYYVPSRKLQRLLAKGRLKPSDLRRNVHNDDLPDLFAPDVDLDHKKFLARIADTVWKSLGTIPTDALSRVPFTKGMYDLKMRSLIATHKKDHLTPEDIDGFVQISRKYALEQTRRTLFDLTDTTNFTDAVRFVAPFWGAQQEAIVKWLRIVADRPETVARFFMGQRAVYRNFAIVDQDGQPTDDSTREGGMHNLGIYHPEDRMVVQIPEFMRKGPLGKSLDAIGSVRIPLGSANTILQGEMPLMPGAGPIMTVPVNTFLNEFDKNHGVTHSDEWWFRWLFPVGKPNGGSLQGALSQVMPGWGRRVTSATAGEGDLSKANLFFTVGREMTFRNQKKGLPPPTEEQVAKATNWLWGLRTFTSFVAPVQMEYAPRQQALLDQAHLYRKKYGADWFEIFMEENGKEATLYAMSSSNAVAGIPPTRQGQEEWSANSALIAKYPEWGAAIVSPDAFLDDYAQDVYRAQFDINLGPGDSRTIRQLNSPQARFAKADEQMGWVEFRKFNAAINAELYSRGLTSIQQTEARDLAVKKALFVDALSKQYPAWRERYDDFGQTIYSRVAELQEFAFNKEFDNRPDMEGVRQYLELRAQVAAELDRHYIEDNGSRSLQAQENGQLAAWFYGQVGQLILDNPAFGDFYSRYLDGDTLEKGSGGIGAPS